MNYTILVHVLADGDGEGERLVHVWTWLDAWMLHDDLCGPWCSVRRPKVLTTIRSMRPALRPNDTLMCLFDVTALSLGVVSWLSRISPPNVSRWGLCKTRTRKDEMYWNVHLLPSDMSPLFGLPSSSIFWAFEVWHWFHAERTCWSNNAPVAHVLICSTINGSEFIYQVQVRFLFWVRAINMCIYIYPNHFKYLRMGVS